MRVFFPIEEAGIDDDAALLVPYRCGLACAGALRAHLVLRDGVWAFGAPDSERAPGLPDAGAQGPA
ncbi:hypothetical protein [Dokdonella sp.]|uniref:hypothetical protein n=1 Tax=Dokdonella sp. TaxID=2291710 RepID=UPI002F40460E